MSRPELLARVEYAEALRLQRELVRRRVEGELPDLVWYLEHEPVVTWGSKGGRNHLRREPADLEALGVDLFPTDRGGDITYHGPGQLVGYPIVHLGQDRDLHQYLRSLEEGIIGLLGDLGLNAERVEGRTGVWVRGAKIAALGVRVSRWVTSHGFALNVDCDLSGFDLIVPCGIADAGVTSIARETAGSGSACPRMEDLVPALHGHLEAALGRPLRALYAPPC